MDDSQIGALIRGLERIALALEKSNALQVQMVWRDAGGAHLRNLAETAARAAGQDRPS
jgi:hypothetical protein